MSKQIDNGGAAFPKNDCIEPDMEPIIYGCGMSLLDYFAAAALPSIIAKDDGKTEWYDKDGGKRTVDNGYVLKGDKFNCLETAAERCATEAYEIACAMIQARKENGQP